MAQFVMALRPRSIGSKLFWAIGMPALIACVAGVGLVWRQVDRAVAVDQPELRQQVATVFGHALTSVLVLFALLLAVTAISLRVILTRPLRRLAQRMERAEEGDFLVRADLDRQDAIGDLANAFDRMLRRLTSMKAREIDTHRDLQLAQEQLVLKRELEEANRTLSQRMTEQMLLFDVARSLTSTLEVSEIFSRISSLIGEQLQIPRFSIMLVQGEQLVVKSAWPKEQIPEGLHFELGEGACGRAARSGTAVYIPDLQQDSEVYLRRPGEPVASGTLLSMPMKHQDSMLGIINFERPGIDAFTPEEIVLLGAVTDLAAVATKNALLHEETVGLSITDPLTGAANRRYLFGRLEMEVARAARYQSPLSVLMVDIDHFKHLNDTSGHRAGDVVLKKVCDLLRSATRKVDTLARYGGEEFMLILPQVTRAEALEVGEKLRRTIAEAPFEEGREQPLGRVTISVGAASLHLDAQTLEQLVDCADSALYASKRNGRNRCTAYEPGMEAHPGRERGPLAAKRRRTGEVPLESTRTGS